MTFLLVVCIFLGLAQALSGWEGMLYIGIGTAIVCFAIMIYACWQKLKSIETKIDKMNEKENSENNSKE